MMWAFRFFMMTNGTHSVLDVIMVVPADDTDDLPGTVRPFTPDETRQVFGTAEPGRADYSRLADELLPEDGELRVGSVILSGRRIRARKGTEEPAGWITDEPVPNAGSAWCLLSELATETGLQPVLHMAPGEPPPDWHPADDFGRPADVGQIDRLNAGDILMREWAGRAVGEEVPGGAVGRFDPADRPARARAAAQAIAAELWAFADAWMDYRDRRYTQLNEVSDIIPRVLDATIWGLWWD